MKKHLSIVLLVLLTLSVTASPSLAKDAWHKFSAKEAQSSELGKEKLDANVKLYMKGQKHGKASKTYGEFKSNKRTNSLGKSAQGACDRAFISALLALQSRASKEGGNAVIDIYSITKDKKFESASEYSCVKGSIVTNVALSGTVVKIGK